MAQSTSVVGRSELNEMHQAEVDQRCRFILASGSQRRKSILALAGVDFLVLDGVGGLQEITPCTEPDASTLTRRNAMIKLRRVVESASNRFPWDCILIGADTTVAVDSETLGKPNDGHEAWAMLLRLRDRWHDVFTSVAITYSPMRLASKIVCQTVASRVKMRNYADAEIARYVASGTPFDRAGGYGVQDADFNPVSLVDGCYLNVVGMPLCAVRSLLPIELEGLVDSHVYATCAAHENRTAS